jgi:hypothetical protein
MMPTINTIPNRNGRAPAESATAKFCVPDQKDNNYAKLHLFPSQVN